MTNSVYVGGTHRVSDSGISVPVPNPDPNIPDAFTVASGNLIAINQPVNIPNINLTGTAGPASFTAYGATITGTLGIEDTPSSDTPSLGVLSFVGSNTNNGIVALQLADPFQILVLQKISLSDVKARDGVIIQRAILVNNGILSLGNSVISASDDAEIINNGTLDLGTTALNVALYGTGSIEISRYSYDAFSPLAVSKPVGEGQSIALGSVPVTLLDPLHFRATITDFPTALDYLSPALSFAGAVTSASFINHILTLMHGPTILAELHFSADTTINEVGVNTANGRVTVFRPGGFASLTSNVAIVATGVTPYLAPLKPPAIANLPTHGRDITIATGALVASVNQLDGYTVRLQGVSQTAAPSLNISSITFGAGFALLVDGASTAARFGGLAAVGYNENDGTIAAVAGSNGHAASLAFGITDVTSAEGLTVLAGSYNNKGAITAGAGSTVSVTGSADSKLINAGTITASGMMFLGTMVTGTGTMTVGSQTGAAGSLEVGGYVASGQSINLQAGKLTIDDTQHFFATICGFGSGDSVVLHGLDVSKVSYNNGALLLDDGVDGTLHFHRPNGVTFTSNSFVLGHSGADTIITSAVVI